MLNPKIRKKMKRPDEYGLFAAEHIAEGELVWNPAPAEPGQPVCMSMRQIEQLPIAQKDVFLRYCYQVGLERFSGYLRMEDVLLDDANFMNHSCDPNCWYEGDTLIARRGIKAGEEITYDYGTDCTGRDWGFTCACGSPLCRGVIGRNDWKKLRPVYGTHFIRYIVENFPEFSK